MKNKSQISFEKCESCKNPCCDKCEVATFLDEIEHKFDNVYLVKPPPPSSNDEDVKKETPEETLDSLNYRSSIRTISDLAELIDSGRPGRDALEQLLAEHDIFLLPRERMLKIIFIWFLSGLSAGRIANFFNTDPQRIHQRLQTKMKKLCSSLGSPLISPDEFRKMLNISSDLPWLEYLDEISRNPRYGSTLTRKYRKKSHQ